MLYDFKAQKRPFLVEAYIIIGVVVSVVSSKEREESITQLILTVQYFFLDRAKREDRRIRHMHCTNIHTSTTQNTTRHTLRSQRV